ncbi:MAG TPA: ABC transporter permease [Gemmatimonadaceae bacterium]|nr:ABC transporter permease [Gemmatimonadaceae bacterium]
MDTFLQDLRYAYRQLVANRSMSIIAILTLALGIGANMSVLSLINATLFKPAPASEPGQLVWVALRNEQRGRFTSWSYPRYKDFAEFTRSYTGVLTYGSLEISLGGDNPQRMRGLAVSGNYFDVLGLRPALGRTLHASDDAPGGPPVAVISHATWMARFGGDSTIVGKQVVINAQPFTLVGVAPKGFTGISLGDATSVWLPVASVAAVFPDSDWMLTGRNSGWLRTVARLKSDRSVEQAASEAIVVAPRLEPDSTPPDDRRTLVVTPLAGGLDPANRAEAAPILGLIMVVPLLVLAVACANVANLFVARGMRRRKELAVRRALGASRARLVRQLLTECVLLAIAAAGVGTLVSSWLTAIITKVAAVPPDVAPALVPDIRVFIATFVLSVAAGVLFGLLPSLSVTRDTLTPALKNESVTLRVGRTRHYLRNTFVVGQVAVSLLLLITAGLFVGSLTKALSVNPGFEAHNTVAMAFDLRAQGYTDERINAFQMRLLDELSATTGIEAAALANVIPLSSRSMNSTIQREGAADGDYLTSQFGMVTADFFSTLRIPFVRGRAFTRQEVAAGARVMVINETLAREFWPNEDPLGKRINFGSGSLREVIGVVRDGKYRTLAETRALSHLWVPATTADLAGDVTLVARGTADTKTTIDAATGVFRRLDANLPLFRIASLDENLAGTVDGQRAGAGMLAVFGTLAITLAALGIFGVISQGVATRTREIGIRMSLGARSADVVGAFVREGLGLTLIGGVIGVGLSFAVSKLLGTLLFGLRATDAITFASACGILGLIALVASFVPARRAAKVDPLIALRTE